MEGGPMCFHTASKTSQRVFGKAPLTSRETMMRSNGSMSAIVSWRKMVTRSRGGPATGRCGDTHR